MLATLPQTENPTNSECTQRLLRASQSDPMLTEPGLYDELELADVEPDPAHSSSPFTRTYSVPVHRRQATTLPAPGQRRRMTEVSRSAINRQSVRGVHDPLPALPPGPTTLPAETPEDTSILEIQHEAETEPERDTPQESNENDTPRAVQGSNNPMLVNTKQFSFEDGSLIQDDIPPFNDPEIEAPNLRVPQTQASIYSSQILSSSDNKGEDAVGNERSEFYTFLTMFVISSFR